MILRLWREVLMLSRLLPAREFSRWGGAMVRALPAAVRGRSLGPVDREFGTSFFIRGQPRGLAFSSCDLGVVREIFGQQCYGRAGDFARDRLIVDLGANCGVFTLFALVHAPESRVFAVEAQPEMIGALRGNLERNGLLPRVTVANALAGGVCSPWAEDLLQRHPQVKVWDASQMLSADQEIDFLKCDIEGAEYLLFDPVPAWFRRVRRFALEYHGDWARGSALGDRIRAAGFTVTQRAHRNLGYLNGARIDD